MVIASAYAAVTLGIASLVSMILIFSAKTPPEQTGPFIIVAVETLLSFALLSMLVPLMELMVEMSSALFAFNSRNRLDFEKTAMVLIAGKNAERGSSEKTVALYDAQLDLMTSMKELLKMEMEKFQAFKCIREKSTECNTSSAASSNEIFAVNEVDVKSLEAASDAGASSVSAAMTT
jgi:hypothetical protein